MPEGVLVQHPPAVKVGGRRLSVSKHRAHTADTHNASSVNKNTAAKSDEDVDTDAAGRAAADYPRPAPPGPTTANDAPPLPPPQHTHQHQHQHQHQHNEDEAPPKKDRNEKKVQELPHWKLETTRPTRDNIHGGSKGHPKGMRIAQPAGKGFGV